MTTDRTSGIGIGILVAIGLGYIISRIPFINNLSFFILLILALFLIFFSKK